MKECIFEFWNDTTGCVFSGSTRIKKRYIAAGADDTKAEVRFEHLFNQDPQDCNNANCLTSATNPSNSGLCTLQRTTEVLAITTLEGTIFKL